MGGAVSAGRDNNELVEKLIRIKYLRTPNIQRAFRAVDRGDYFLPNEKEHAYADLAWKSGLLHLSAPCIYCDVMEALKLKPGLSFLNLGSGTGYLSTMAGLILGTGGVNHGIELHDIVVDYANKKLFEFVNNSSAVDELDFCEPKFVVGNCLSLPPTTQLYDRVYCGAACPNEYESYFKKLIKIGGILVMPLDDYLLRIKRTSEDGWETQKLLHVSFTTLITPKDFEKVDLPNMEPPSLQLLCRSLIRKVLRNVIAKEHPTILESLTKYEQDKVKHKNNVETLCIAINDDNSDQDEYESFNNIHNLDLESGSREMNALLRLVLSMGNRTRDMLVRDLPEAVLVYSDEEVTSSEDEASMLSEFYSSGSSSTNNDGADNENDEKDNSSSNNMEDVENGEIFSVAPGPSKPSSSNNDEDKPSISKSVDKDNSLPDIEMKCTSSSILNPTEHKSKDISNKRKVDSGIDDSSNAAGCNGYSSSNNESVLMDTSSSDSSDSFETSRIIGAEIESEQWGHRKRHLPDDEDTSDKGDSSDSDTASRAGKIKRKVLPRPHPYDTNRKKLTSLLQGKIQMLALPPLLKKFVNMNRDLPD